MIDMNSNEYFERKKALLKECVTLSEEMLSNINEIDKINNILLKRSEKIHLLQELEDNYGEAFESIMSDNQKSQINQIVSLLLGLDRDTEKKIKNEQLELKKRMKVNIQNQKMISYTGKYAQTSGRLLDKKK